MKWKELEFEEIYAIPSRNGLSRPARVRGEGFKMINMGELFAHDRIGAIDMELVPMNDREFSPAILMRMAGLGLSWLRRLPVQAVKRLRFVRH